MVFGSRSNDIYTGIKVSSFRHQLNPTQANKLKFFTNSGMYMIYDELLRHQFRHNIHKKNIPISKDTPKNSQQFFNPHQNKNSSEINHKTFHRIVQL